MKKILILVLAFVLCMGATNALAANVAVKKVTLNTTGVHMMPGQTFTLVAKIEPANATNKKITWSSSNKTVATVNSNGLVTAKGNGSATITAKSNNGKTAKATIYVVGFPDKLQIKEGAFNLQIGKTKQLTVKYVPSDALQDVLWESSNSKVATVNSNGVVTGKTKGTSQITVRCAGKKTVYATVKVTVTEPTITGFSVSDDGICKWNAVPGAAYYEVRWERAYITPFWKNQSNIKATSFAVPESKLTVGKKYAFEVRAIYYDGNNKQQKTAWSSTIRKDIKAGAVRNLKYTQNGSIITVTWDPPRFAKYYNISINNGDGDMNRSSTSYTIDARNYGKKIKVLVYAHPGSPNGRYGTSATIEITVR